MNLLKELTSISKENNVKVKQSFHSEGCNEYEFFDNNNRKICYIVEYLDDSNSASHGELLYYELYYDNSNDTNNYDDDDFCSSNDYDDTDFLCKDLIDIIS